MSKHKPISTATHKNYMKNAITGVLIADVN